MLETWFRGFGEVFSFELFSFGPKYCAKKKPVHTLLNFISGSAKLAIWLTRKNQVQTVGSVEPVSVLRGLLKARLRVEHAYYKMMGTLQVFKNIWAVEEVLCSVGEDGELDIHI